MTKYARLSNHKLSGRKQAAAPKVRTWQTLFQNRRILNGVLAVMVVGLGLTYLGITNSTAADTFTVHSLSERIETNKQEARDLELAVSEVLSLQHIDTMSEQYELVAATDVQYIDTDSAFALRQ